MTYEPKWYPGMPSLDLLLDALSNGAIDQAVFQMGQNIWNLIMGYCEFYNLNKEEYVVKFFSHPFETINTDYSDIITNLNLDGNFPGQQNLRSRMSMYMAIIMNGCDIIWWLLVGYHINDSKVLNVIKNSHVSVKSLKYRIKALQRQFGYTFDDIIKASCAGGDPFNLKCTYYQDPTSFSPSAMEISLCKMALYAREGPPRISRLVIPQIRTKRSLAEKALYVIHAYSIIPELAPLEIKKLQIDNNGTIPDPIPWSFGAKVFKTNRESIFDELQEESGGIFIAGPSGTTKELLDMGDLFKDFTPGTAGFQAWLVAVLIFLTSGRHHSVDEVMLAAQAYGDEYDMEHLKADDVMRELMKPFNSPKKLSQYNTVTMSGTQSIYKLIPIIMLVTMFIILFVIILGIALSMPGIKS